MKSWIVLLLATSSALVAASPPTTARVDWKAGVAKTVITPTEPIWLAGFGSRTRPSEGVRQDIYVRAAALQDPDGKTSVVTTFDLVAIEREFADEIARRVRERFGLTRDRLLLNVSHTHSAPVAGLVLMPMYDLNAAQRETVRRYTDALLDQVIDTIGRAIDSMAPARIEFGQGLAGIAVNRRRVRQRALPGPVDQDVPVLAMRGADGSLRGVLVGYATHATALSDYLVSGDWPGFALQAIEKNQPGATALFIQGCGADANPLPRRDEELARQYGDILAAAVDEVLRSRMTPLPGPMRTVFATVDVPFERVPTRDELQQRLADRNAYVRRHAQRLLETLDRDGQLPAAYPYPVQVWQFGRELTLIALGGEVVVDYSLRLKRQYGFDTTWVAGYSNDILAYIPSRRVWEEGGYEGGDAMIYFGRPSRFAPSVEEIIVGRVATLVNAVRPAAAAGPAK